jgi:DNA-binding NarL/FixJ family response regulator
VPIRVLLAEDNALLRQGLERLLGADGDVELVASVGDQPSVEKVLREQDVDVVVTDIRMPPSGTDEGLQIAAALRVDRPATGVVVLSQHADATYALRLLEGGSGGRAYLLKERVSDVGELSAAIRAVAAGGSVVDPTVVEQLVAANAGARRTPLAALTPRETEVLGEMAQGKSNAAIAAHLVLSERAIEKHTNSIFAKLGLTEEPDVNRRVKAVLLYLHDGSAPVATTSRGR